MTLITLATLNSPRTLSDLLRSFPCLRWCKSEEHLVSHQRVSSFPEREGLTFGEVVLLLEKSGELLGNLCTTLTIHSAFSRETFQGSRTEPFFAANCVSGHLKSRIAGSRRFARITGTF